MGKQTPDKFSVNVIYKFLAGMRHRDSFHFSPYSILSWVNHITGYWVLIAIQGYGDDDEIKFLPNTYVCICSIYSSWKPKIILEGPW